MSKKGKKLTNLLWIYGITMIVLHSCAETSLNSERMDQMNEDNPEILRFEPRPYVEITHPKWSKNATIYEVNVRQYTPEGTFKAFETHLPRLKEMGVGIIWLMPVHPIGVKNRKGSLGSYYSVQDYYGINPEFGDMSDFRSLVNKIHDLGMYIIIDWVANHTSWDNPLVEKHPDWYKKDAYGRFQSTPWYDWSDIIELDYSNKGLRQYMSEVMFWWVKETDIDGFRCDIAGFIPIDFWEELRKGLDQIKPVFMLAEWESRDLHKKAFDMTYSWSLWDKMHTSVKENLGVAPILDYMAHDVSTFPSNAYRMTFTDNHDKNSWEGSLRENFGSALEASIVLTCTVKGMPLVYSGQEAGLERPLAFFDKDVINWQPHPHYDLFKTLFHEKKRNKALWNGSWGGEMIRITNDKSDQVLSFFREKEGDKIIVIMNYSPLPCTTTIFTSPHIGSYKDIFNNTKIRLKGNDVMHFPPWSYKVLVKE